MLYKVGGEYEHFESRTREHRQCVEVTEFKVNVGYSLFFTDTNAFLLDLKCPYSTESKESFDAGDWDKTAGRDLSPSSGFRRFLFPVQPIFI